MASLTASLETARSSPSDFVFWYPSWDTWKFRRTLTYWIAVTFAEGSVLFVMGASFAMSGLADVTSPSYHRVSDLALVGTPYCIGALCFTVGAYCGVLEVVNLTTREGERLQFFVTGVRHVRQIAAVVDLRCFWSYMANFVGAIAFNVNTISGYFELGFVLNLVLVWGMAALGGFCFTLGAVMDCGNNKVWRLDIHTAQWWASVGNLIGGICFLEPGVVGLFSPSHEVYYWLIDFVYLVGSVAFFAAAVFLMWMWKNEQYGLGRMPELNSFMRPERLPTNLLDFHAEYGCGKSDAWQIPWLLLYGFNASLSVIDIAIVIFVPIESEENSYQRVLQALLNFMLSHGVLFLGSVLHHVPTKRPFSWLVIYMRFVLSLYTLHSAWSVWKEVRELRNV
ncbi:unnamed protein product [Symbiodinium natans]|uniref:Uncharacterized protein n=1 Tax=Symbiodinium natans TaxID=878477 RepID=A0A812Q4J4_9DINO|nr:unnamed protein product [Symbiodinium natans]